MGLEIFCFMNMIILLFLSFTSEPQESPYTTTLALYDLTVH